MFFRLRLSTLASTIFRLRLPRKTLTPTTPTRQPWADVCNRGVVVKFELEGALYNAKKSIILYHMFLNFFSHAPFSVNYFCPRPTTRAVQCEYCCPSPPKISRWGYWISTSIREVYFKGRIQKFSQKKNPKLLYTHFFRCVAKSEQI